MEDQPTKIIYVVYTKVLKIRQEFAKVYTGGFGESARFNEIPQGWFAHLEGSYEALFLGHEEPTLRENDRVKITFERIASDQPIQPSE